MLREPVPASASSMCTSAESDLGVRMKVEPSSKQRFWKGLALGLGTAWILLYVVPFFVFDSAFWNTWIPRLWFVIPPMTVLATIGLTIHTPPGHRSAPTTTAVVLTVLWLGVLLAIVLHS